MVTEVHPDLMAMKSVPRSPEKLHLSEYQSGAAGQRWNDAGAPGTGARTTAAETLFGVKLTEYLTLDAGCTDEVRCPTTIPFSDRPCPNPR